MYILLFLSVFISFERERELNRGEAEREREKERERILSRLHAVCIEPNEGLSLMNGEIMT